MYLKAPNWDEKEAKMLIESTPIEAKWKRDQIDQIETVQDVCGQQCRVI